MKIMKIILTCLIFLYSAQSIAADHSADASYYSLSTYEVGAGDRISVRVFGEPDFSISGVTLTDSASFMFPSIGEVSVRGKNLSEIEKMIAGRLRERILVDPRVYVSLDEYRPFFISGAVNRPGNIPFQPGLTISKAAAIAGGLTENANPAEIYMQLPDGTKKLVKQNEPVKPGDNIQIKAYEPIYVNGMVRAGGGSFPYETDGLNVRKAISLAGGFHERANVNKIYIVRNSDPKQIPVLVNLNDIVEPGDTITVEESFF